MKKENRLNILLDILKEKSENPDLWLDYNSLYGGYRLVKRDPKHGGISGVFGFGSTDERLSRKEMEIKLTALIAGIRYSRDKNL